MPREQRYPPGTLWDLPGHSPGAGFYTRLEYRAGWVGIRIEYAVKLEVAPVNTSVAVNAEQTLIDPNMPSSIMQIGSTQIEDRLQSLPGRSVQDPVNTQPGWLYEGNAVLYPRGSEYQTQFVSDGIPSLTIAPRALVRKLVPTTWSR